MSNKVPGDANSPGPGATLDTVLDEVKRSLPPLSQANMAHCLRQGEGTPFSQEILQASRHGCSHTPV